MQERKNKKRFLLLAVLTIITLLVFWWIQPENRLAADQHIFQVPELGSVSRIAMVSDTSEVTLRFNGTQWRVNQQYNADGDMIRVLFATLQQARPKRAVPRMQRDSIFARLERSGVRVSLYSGQDMVKEFFAGGNRAKTQAFFADPASNEVYVMAIPGYRVYVSGIFELPETGWRDKFVFGFNWRNFKSLEAQFLKSPAENFSVVMNNDQFGVEGLAKTDTARLNTFLDDVSLLTVDEYIAEPALSDSLLSLDASFELRVTDAGNHSYRLRLYETPHAGHVLGIVQDSVAALFDRKKIQRLLKPKSFFRKS